VTTGIRLCTVCKKTYKTRAGLSKHLKKHHTETPFEDTSKDIDDKPLHVTNNIANQTNNIQQNITIRPFGKENPKWITEKVIVDALRNIPGAIMNLVKEKHFNDKFPENRNVELCGEFRNRYLTVQDDTRKRMEDKKDMYMRMCNNACDAVTSTLESYSEPPEDKRCHQVARRIRRSEQISTVVDRYIGKWHEYVSTVGIDDVLKDADHYITMLLLDLKLALAHEEETANTREVS